MTAVVLALACATAGGLLARKLRIPGGTILGAIAGAAVFRFVDDTVALGPEWSALALMIVGTSIGSMIDKSLIRSFGRIALPGGIAVVAMLASGIVIATVMTALGLMPPIAALFAFAPGGIAEMSAAATALSAAAPLVAAAHVVRIVVVLVAMPVIMRALVSRQPDRAEAENRSHLPNSTL